MIETLRALLNDPSVPSLHVLLVHFPIALLVVALLFDIGCLFFRRRAWLDRAATSLYFIGTVGAGAAYLSGQRAAAALHEISGTAEATLADHQDLALATLAAFSGVTLLRMLVSWLGFTPLAMSSISRSISQRSFRGQYCSSTASRSMIKPSL